MFLSNFFKSGWVHALILGLIICPLGTMTQKFAASTDGVNILVYTATCMLASSFALLLSAGPGRLARESLKLPQTWLYGLFDLFTLSVGVVIMVYISATEAAALARTTALFSFILSIIFLNQPSSKIERIGFFVLFIGFIYSSALIDLPLKYKITLIFLIIIKNILQASKKIISETHKTNRKAKNLREDLRVAGCVMAISSMITLIVLLSIASVQTYYDIQIHSSLPMLKDFASKNMYIASIWGGIILLAILRYLEFYVSKTLGAKYLMAMISLQIIGVYFMEMAMDGILSFQAKEMTIANFVALGLILLGNLTIAGSGFIKDFKFIKKGEKQDTLANLDGNFIEDKDDFELVKFNLSNLLNLYDSDSKALSADIEISRITLDNIINYDYGEFKVENKIAKKINDFANQHVATKDKLTKAHNRYYLDHIATSLFKKNELFNLYYLDLNKFKPINDKYGHEVGDYVLAETVAKLNALQYFDDYVFRVGGDEFVLIQIGNIEEQLESLITQVIEEPVEYQEIPLAISTSIGRVSSENYDNVEDMIKDADELMFKHKKIMDIT